jgi:hypothetical protein
LDFRKTLNFSIGFHPASFFCPEETDMDTDLLAGENTGQRAGRRSNPQVGAELHDV